MKLSLKLVAGAMLSVMAFGCAGGGAKNAKSAADLPPSIVIEDTAEWEALVAQGEESYVKACGACHPGGDADLGPKLKGGKGSVAWMTKQIREGSGRMRPIGPDQLAESEMKGLMVYMRTLDAVADVKGP